MMLACTLPVLEILTLLGGIDPNALLGGFVVTLGSPCCRCSLAMALSLWVGKTHRSASLHLFDLVHLAAGRADGWHAWTDDRLAWPAFRGVRAVLSCAAPYWWPGRVGWGDYVLFLAVTVSISALC